jgi:curved DNA-binding protein CbpA
MSARLHDPQWGPEQLRAYLEELGLTPPITSAQLKAAYRQRSRELHPDRNPGADANDAMARLNEAHRALEAYIQSFQYRFDDEEYFAQFPRQRVRRQFSDSDNWRRDPRKRRT